MALFSYQAVNEQLAERCGTIVADTAWQARDLLRQRGLTVQSVQTHRQARSWAWPARRHPGRLTMALRELATLLSAGVPLLQAIDGVAEQQRGNLRTCLLMLRQDVAAGVGLAQAMRHQERIFDELSVSLIEVGEAAGALESSLERLCELRERSGELRSRVTACLLYPAIVLILGLAVSVLLMTVVVPELLAALVEAGRPLPWTTRCVQAMSELLLRWWWLAGLAMAALAAGLGAALRTEQGRWHWDRVLLRLPLLGPMIRRQAIVRLAVVLATLLRGGMVLVAAVRVARGSVGNRVLARALERFEQAIQAGQDLAAALEATGVFPRTVVQLVGIGQQSGRLEEMLERLAKDYDRQVATMAQRLTALLEPLLIIVLAGWIGFIAFATILPILEAGHVL
jgi:type II secretory pathway component PulF